MSAVNIFLNVDFDCLLARKSDASSCRCRYRIYMNDPDENECLLRTNELHSSLTVAPDA